MSYVTYQDPCKKYADVWNTYNTYPGVAGSSADKMDENNSWFLANCIVDKLNSI